MDVSQCEKFIDTEKKEKEKSLLLEKLSVRDMLLLLTFKKQKGFEI